MALLGTTACAGVDEPDDVGDVASDVTVRPGVDYRHSQPAVRRGKRCGAGCFDAC